MNNKQKPLFYFAMMVYKNWLPRNTRVMEPDLRLAYEALVAMGED